ncbi:MAG: BatA and WFA domain-containing protein [Verrucomicrobiaceae bacterium]|nr:BatA and WFA domain-containing protein [Verrucomicrobiaceae bacterium]
MNFLFPLFLAAGAAVIAPLLLHLRRQPPSKVTEFSSLDFLQPTAVPTTTKRRLERWLLLLLRCLALLLLALIFARPYRSSADADLQKGRGTATLILLDRSASMSRGDLWEDAVSRVLDHVGRAHASDRLAVGVFDRKLERVLGFDDTAAQGVSERLGLAQAALKELKPGVMATQMDAALIDAVTWMDETRRSGNDELPPPSSREVVLVTDLQEGASLERLRGFTWPQDITLDVEVLSPDDTSVADLAIAMVNEQDSKAEEVVRARLTASGQADAVSYELLLDEKKIAAGQAIAGTSRIVKAILPDDEKSHSLKVLGDEWELNNVVHLAPRQPARPVVLVLSSAASVSDSSSALYYLKRALQPTARLMPELLSVRPSDDISVWSRASSAIVIADGPLGKHLASARAFAEGGGNVLVLLGDTDHGLHEICGPGFQFEEAVVKNYALLTNLDTSHPLLAPFDDQRLANFNQMHIWKHRLLKGGVEGASKLIEFDDGSPALVELARGKGRVFVMATTWSPADSQLALVPQFVPFVYSWLSIAGSTMDASHQLLTGEMIPGTQKVADALGLVKEGNETYAVNLPPDESRLAPQSPAKFAGMNIPMSDQPGSSEEGSGGMSGMKLEHEALERQQGYWFLLLGALLWIVGMETWLASRGFVGESRGNVQAQRTT